MHLKNGKALGIDEVVCKVVKIGDDTAIGFVKCVCQLGRMIMCLTIGKKTVIVL